MSKDKQDGTPEVIYRGAPLFHTIQAPILLQHGVEAVRNFQQARRKYEQEVAERQKQPGGSDLQPQSLRLSVDPDLRDSLIFLNVLGTEVYTAADVTDSVIENWIDTVLNNIDSKATKADLDTAVKSLRMNMQEKDAEQRVVQLFIKYHSTLRRHNRISFVKEHPKDAVNHILSRIQPAELKERIISDLEFDRKELQKDFLGFFRYCKEEAKKCSRYFPVNQAGNSTGNRDYSPPGVKSAGGQSAVVQKGGNTAGKQVKINNSTMPHANPKSDRSLPDCLNPKCTEKHYITACANTPESEKKELKQAYYNKKNNLEDAEKPETRANTRQQTAESLAKAKGKPSGTVRRARDLNLDNGQMSAVMADICPVIALADCGADDNVVSRFTADQLASKGSFVPTQRLKDPITMQLTAKDMTAISTERIRVSLTLNLDAGPLRMRNLDFLVLEADFEEVLLGRPLMKHLGIDVTAHLNSVRSDFHEHDFSEVESLDQGAKGKLSRALLTANHVEPISAEMFEEQKTSHSSVIGNTTESRSKDLASLHQAPSQIIHGTLEDHAGISSTPSIPIGEDLPGEVAAALAERVNAAKCNGLSAVGVIKLKNLLLEYENTFALKLGPQPPCRFPPMIVQMPHDVRPVRSRPRPMPTAKRMFVQQETTALAKYGMIFSNPTSEWAHPVHVVPKPGAAQFRMTVDLRQCNALQKKSAYPMPHLESALQNLEGTTVYGTYDMIQCYWQMLYDEKSQETQTFVTPDGIWTPRRVLHGNSNSVAHLQSSMDMMLQPLSSRVMAWLDDLLSCAANESELLDVHKSFLELCRSNGVLLHAHKCDFFHVQARWCGRLISSAGVKFDPRHMQGLLDMPSPVMRDQLLQFICALGWLRTSIPEFTSIIAPLHDIMTKVYSAAGQVRTKRAASRVTLSSVGWSQTETECFNTCKVALQNATSLAHRNEELRLCVYTDASERHWSSVVTQVPHEDLDLPHAEQNHEPLAFLSGSFTGAPFRWSIVDKEGYAIMQTCERLDYLLRCPSGFSLYSDHRNLIYIFDPRGRNPGIAQHSEARLLRWALKLASYNYVIEFISGEENVWADLLSRWAAPVLRRVCRVLMAPIIVSPDFVWPTNAALATSQRQHLESRPDGCLLSDDRGLYVLPSGVVWIPDNDIELQLRILVVSHCGAAGHRSHAATSKSVTDIFYWSTLQDDLRTFCETCIHCIATTGGTRTPRPFGEALHATKPNMVLHFDYLYIGASVDGIVYLLLLKDDASGYVWLCPHTNADAASTVDSLVQWFSTFNICSTWCSDQGSHFKNQVVAGVQKALNVQHNFTVAYSPWSNGSVEVVCREVLRSLRALISEFHLEFKHWPSLVPMVQSMLNNQPADRLNGVAPITAMTALPPTGPLLSVISPVNRAEVLSLDAIKAETIFNTKSVQNSLDLLHKRNAASASSKRDRRRANKNASRNCRLPNFMLGDFVMVGLLTSTAQNKLAVRWRGPRRIISEESQWVYVVQDLLTNASTAVHASRLKFYHDSSLDITEELKAHVAHQQTGYEVSTLHDLRWSTDNKQYEVLVSWRGFEVGDNSWEPLTTLLEDVPSLVHRLLQQHHAQTIVAKIRESFNLHA